MEFYSLADATYLLEYYTDKLTGQKLSHKSATIITHLEIDDWDNNKYRLMAKGAGNAAADVCDVVKIHNMQHPIIVLANRKQ